MTVRISSAVQETMLALAGAEPSQEVCGILLGQGDQIDAVTPTPNVAPDPQRHFEIDPTALIAAHRNERAGGPQILGFYHSHPNGMATPSDTDRAMAAADNRIWIIIASGHMAAWRATPNGFIPADMSPVSLNSAEQFAKGAPATRDT